MVEWMKPLRQQCNQINGTAAAAIGMELLMFISVVTDDDDDDECTASSSRRGDGTCFEPNQGECHNESVVMRLMQPLHLLLFRAN